MLELVLSFILALIVSSVIRGWLWFRRGQISSQRLYRERYYNLAHKIITDLDLGDAELTRIRARTVDMDDPRTFRPLMKAILAVDIEIRNGNSKPMQIPPATEGLCRDWVAMLYSYIVAVSYNRPVRGFFMRAALARVLDPSAAIRAAELIDQRMHPLRREPRRAHAGRQAAPA